MVVNVRQNILLWRARMPWQEGLGFPREGRWARSFIGSKTYSTIYTLQNGTVSRGGASSHCSISTCTIGCVHWMQSFWLRSML